MSSFDIPSTWFHGSESVFDQFDPHLIGGATGVRSPGFWFSDSHHASGFFGPCRATCALVLVNPLVVTSEDREQAHAQREGGGCRSPSAWAKHAAARGHDAVILVDVCDGDAYSTVVCVFDPKQVTIHKWEEPEPDPSDEPEVVQAPDTPVVPQEDVASPQMRFKF